MTDSPFFVTLKNRAQIILSGDDRMSFLQGLVSNDITRATNRACVYACLLTPQGKFLHDFFIIVKDNTLVLDCEGGSRAEDLLKRLSLYKLRADIALDLILTCDVYAVMHTSSPLEHEWSDPRHHDMGYRSFIKPDLPERDFDIWDEHRIRLTIPDGSRDMITGKSTLLESNIDRLNGIDFDKGCYIGQELTARMHYRGLVKKRLYAVEGDDINMLPDLRSVCGNVGIALIKDSTHDSLPDTVTLL